MIGGQTVRVREGRGRVGVGNDLLPQGERVARHGIPVKGLVTGRRPQEFGLSCGDAAMTKKFKKSG